MGGINYATNPNSLTIYSQCTRSSSALFALNHQGYIYAVLSGTYSFVVSNADDWVGIWIGPKAYSGWLRSNVDASVAYGFGSATYNTTFVAGQYYPLRIMFAQAQGDAAFAMRVTAPDGTVFLGAGVASSAYLVQYSCDGVTAPRFPAFGSQT